MVGHLHIAHHGGEVNPPGAIDIRERDADRNTDLWHIWLFPSLFLKGVGTVYPISRVWRSLRTHANGVQHRQDLHSLLRRVSERVLAVQNIGKVLDHQQIGISRREMFVTASTVP